MPRCLASCVAFGGEGGQARQQGPADAVEPGVAPGPPAQAGAGSEAAGSSGRARGGGGGGGEEGDGGDGGNNAAAAGGSDAGDDPLHALEVSVSVRANRWPKAKRLSW